MVNYQKNDKESIEFLRSKDFKLIKNIGQGGTGKTVLLLDEMINEKFVCKKYSTYLIEHQKKYYKNFIEEIKLLHLIYHKNIVRVFNYYLYPENTTGYILMEYVEGDTIENYLKNNPEQINSIFIQSIQGFIHLEQNKILHRDIRPENILVSKEGVIKIIDLGFGKKIEFDEDFDNSVSLNWRYERPSDFEIKIYDFRTEIYFVGKLFEEIIIQNNIQNFAYSLVLNEMIQKEYNERINSFFEISRNLLTGELNTISFTEEEKFRYRNFADKIHSFFTKIEINSNYEQNIDLIINNLERVYTNNMLEEHITNLNLITRELIKGAYYFNKNTVMRVDDFHSFLIFFKALSLGKRKILLNNLWSRLDMIQRFEKYDDDLPF